MKFLSFLTVGALFLGALAAPIAVGETFEDLEARAPNLAISLKEWFRLKPNGELQEWHFGLIAHAPGAVPDASDPRKAFPLYHWTIDTDEKCMAFESGGTTKSNQGDLRVTGTLLPAKGETTDAALKKAVVAIFKAIPSSDVKKSGFRNCLDAATLGINHLLQAKYISATDYAKFKAFWDAKQEEVRRATDPQILAECGLTRRGFLEEYDEIDPRAPKRNCKPVFKNRMAAKPKAAPAPAPKKRS
ncbi:hypothetical protein FA13DRAFT_1778107 [Coprinellus micaceus]|uniref:Uncharacterized protein n=1 Tax=Coprinellus micaceus TaxID=71717 RepID=A0A4Y7SQB4_COPMI|nr:hypothetical protein FA13DRAFT_1778107 [Coprinellus micaceus]